MSVVNHWVHSALVNKQPTVFNPPIVKDLVGNSQAAMMAAMEIYNKPMFQYREECTVILLLNAWELLLKAILAKYGQTIYYPIKPNQLPRTLSWKDAYRKAVAHFPSNVGSLPAERNLDALASYRDKAIHFYNEDDMALVVYALAQTALVNYRDVLLELFDIDMADQMNLRLLPLATRSPLDVISYIQGHNPVDGTSEASQFISELAKASTEVRQANEDTGRLLTVFNVKLESVKKIGDSDIVVGVDNDPSKDSVSMVVQRQNPNETHPLLRKEVLSEIGVIYDMTFTGHAFQAIDRKYGIKGNPQFHWQDDKILQHKYSRDVIPFIRKLTKAEIELAIKEYNDYFREISKKSS